jgi:hypothetical protein
VPETALNERFARFLCVFEHLEYVGCAAVKANGSTAVLEISLGGDKLK